MVCAIPWTINNNRLVVFAASDVVGGDVMIIYAVGTILSCVSECVALEQH